MSRVIPAPLLTHLQGQVLTLATMAKITRLDGGIIALTSCDKDLTFAGQLYQAMDPVSASSLRASEGQSIDNLQFAGVLLSSPLITDTDLLAGRYDGASVELFQVNWQESPLVNRIGPLITGSIGEITFSEGTYQAEIRALGQRLAQQIGEVTSPTCRVRALFDARCNPPGNTTPTSVPANFQFTRTVATVVSPTVLTFSGDAHATGYFSSGRVVFSTGLNAGLQKEVKSHTFAASVTTLTLQEAFPFAVAIGDTAMLEKGCSRTVPDCQSFGNMINFRGEPFIPGNAVIQRRGRH